MGRPKETPRVKITARVLPETEKRIRADKQSFGTLGKVIDHAIKKK